jgi:hypothetical protein
LSHSEKVDFFKRWLTESQNDDNFLIIDDIDGLPQDAIADALPQDARNVLFTTRNPTMIAALAREHQLKCYHLGVTEMKYEDMIDFTIQAFREVNTGGDDEQFCTEGQIQAISKASAGHPLIASRTVFYIMTNLVEEYGPDAVKEYIEGVNDAAVSREAAAAIFMCKPPLQCSILESFEVSRKRLPDLEGRAWVLLQMIAFLVLDGGSFQKFLFLKRPWIHELKLSLTYYETWSAQHADLRRWLFELTQVSFGTRDRPGDHMRFHPVLIRYLQEHVGHAGRIAIVRDIMLLAYESAMKLDILPSETWESTSEMLHAHVLHCYEISKVYSIALKELNVSDDLYKWFINNGVRDA